MPESHVQPLLPVAPGSPKHRFKIGELRRGRVSTVRGEPCAPFACVAVQRLQVVAGASRVV